MYLLNTITKILLIVPTSFLISTINADDNLVKAGDINLINSSKTPTHHLLSKTPLSDTIISKKLPLYDYALPHSGEAKAIELRYNQVGYHIDRPKIISVTGSKNFESLPFSIRDTEGSEVLKGRTSNSEQWSLSNEYVATLDFSSLNTAGRYVVAVGDTLVTITILRDGYKELSKATLKYYYFNRASTPITSELGGVYAREAGLLDTDVIVHASAASTTRPTGTVIASAKGWFDAGDYNKYVVNSGISTYTLLAAFEHFDDYLSTESYEVPESSNSIPDVLDEIKWNLDWLLTMQDPEDGGVYHKVTGLEFSEPIMPEAYDLDRYVVQKSTAAALNFAAVAAVASRVYARFDQELPEYSKQLLEASIKAYDWAKKNPDLYYKQPKDVVTGEYGDTEVADEFQWATVELYITTQNKELLENIDISTLDNSIPNWQSTAPLALFSIASHTNLLDSTLDIDLTRKKIIETATDIKDRVTNSVMKTGMHKELFTWGSNGEAGNQILYLLKAYQITNDEAYVDAAFTATDYILGRNATGYSFLSGYGDHTVQNPHHRISRADAIDTPVPGMIAGGPQAGQQDKCSGYPNKLPATSYVDDWCSYSTNEVTINWNAPYFYTFTALHVLQKERVKP